MPHEAADRQRFSDNQRAGLQTRRDDQDRTLDAIEQLEAALSANAFRRQTDWHGTLVAALEVLDAATTQELANADEPDSLLSDIERTQPRLRHRVRGVRAQYRQLGARIDSLRHEVATADDNGDIDVADLRHRVALLLSALRYERARESDLIYEAYYEAFQRDIEEDQSSCDPP